MTEPMTRITKDQAKTLRAMAFEGAFMPNLREYQAILDSLIAAETALAAMTAREGVLLAPLHFSEVDAALVAHGESPQTGVNWLNGPLYMATLVRHVLDARLAALQHKDDTHGPE
jgi:hypothetical protein